MEPFVRALVEGCRIKPAPPDSYNKLRQQLSAIGNNLNQLTHIANATGRVSASQLDRAQSLLEDMFKAEDVSKLNRIYEQLGYAIPKVTTADRIMRCDSDSGKKLIKSMVLRTADRQGMC